MKEEVEITDNIGNKRVVNKAFAEAFKKSKLYSKSLGKNFGEFNEIPIEEFAADFKPNRFTYSSDEGLQLIKSPVRENKIILLNADPIRSEKVREFVRERIDFQFTDQQWLVIDVAMGKYWNNRVPGTWICNEDIAGFIFRHCEQEKMLISWERVLKITNGIWEYLEQKGRLIDDNRI